MMNLQFVGWFSDLPHGRSDEVPLDGNIGKLAPEDAQRVADYLELGTVVAETTGAILADLLGDDKAEIGPFRTQTDGKYVWPSDFPYYVRKYAAVAPDPLVKRAKNGPPRALSESEIDEVVDVLLS